MNDGVLQQILDELKSINGRLDNLEQGQTKLEQNYAKLETSVTRLEQGQAKLETSVTRLEQGQAKLEQNYAKLEGRFRRSATRMDDGFIEVNTKLDDIDALITGIVHHQNVDYSSMEELKAVVEIHEERFQKIKAI